MKVPEWRKGKVPTMKLYTVRVIESESESDLGFRFGLLSVVRLAHCQTTIAVETMQYTKAVACKDTNTK